MRGGGRGRGYDAWMDGRAFCFLCRVRHGWLTAALGWVGKRGGVLDGKVMIGCNEETQPKNEKNGRFWSSPLGPSV